MHFHYVETHKERESETSKDLKPHVRLGPNKNSNRKGSEFIVNVSKFGLEITISFRCELVLYGAQVSTPILSISFSFCPVNAIYSLASYTNTFQIICMWIFVCSTRILSSIQTEMEE